MIRNIEIPETGKFVNVKKRGKYTSLRLGDISLLKATADSKAFLVAMPISIPVILTLSLLQSIAKMAVLSGEDSALVSAIASIHPILYVAVISGLFATFVFLLVFKLFKMFQSTELSNVVLSSENANAIAAEKLEKKAVVEGNLGKASAESIVETFIAQAYPEMNVESKNADFDYVSDRTFSKVFNQQVA